MLERLFRKLGGRYDLAVSMVGPKLGDNLLQIGCGDGGLLAALAGKVGLTGHAAAVDATPEGVSAGERGAARGGVLVEISEASYQHLPHDDGAFDIVVAHDVLERLTPENRSGCLKEVRRVLRPAGRLVVVEPVPRGAAGIIRTRRGDPDYRATGGAEAALKAGGFVAVRTLADRDGSRYVEGVRPR